MKKLNRLLTSISACALLGIAGCSNSGQETGDADAGGKKPVPETPAKEAFLEDVDAKRAGELVAAASPPMVIDVRTPEEYAGGHIEGAVNVDFNAPNFKEELAKLDRDQTYLMHCRSGGRSGQAKPTFEELGFKAIYHLDGGMIAWEEEGLPTVK